jgi:hypothetical protein
MLSLRHYPMLDKLPKPGTRKDPHRKYRCQIPNGEKGPWRIEEFEVEVDISLMRMMRDGRGTPPGKYKRLMHKTRGVIMSDTDAELGDLRRLFSRAYGRVLIHGLGLGVAVAGCLQIDNVTKVDVVEIDGDVIDLVGSHIKDERLTIHHDDATKRKWPKDAFWNVVWHDIWDNICGDNLAEMRRLERKFKPKCAWQHCWAKEWIR